MKSSVVDLEILPGLHGSAVMVLTKLCFLDNSSLRKTATKITGANQHSVVLLKDWLCEVQQVEEASRNSLSAQTMSVDICNIVH